MQLIRRSTLTAAGFAALAALATWWALTRYSSFAAAEPDVPPAYDSAIRRVLAYALARDSTGIAAMAAAPGPAAWLKIAVATDSGLVRAWTEGPSRARTSRSGDTTLVFWSTPASTRQCFASGSLTAAFLGESTKPRLVRLGSRCIPIAPITFEIGR